MTTVLVTGAGGYIGGRLVQAMSDVGWDVRTLVRDPEPRLGPESIVLDLAEADAEALDAACEGVETVVHLAGENEVMAALEPAASLASTVVSTERLAEAAARRGVKRLIYMSTVHVYGARIVGGARLTEDLRPEPRSSYAISRLASEHIAASLARDGFDLVVFRLTNSVGAPDHPAVDRWTLVANDLCRQGARQGTLELRTAGVQWRDFIALTDVCGAITAAANHGREPTLPAGTYNLGSGHPVTIRALAELIQDTFKRLTGSRPELVAPDPGSPDSWPEPYHVSVDRIAGAGLAATGSLADAVNETARFCLEHREELP